MTSDEQEALSRRYGPDVFSVLSLKSGRIAVIGHFRTLLGIVATWEEALELGVNQPSVKELKPLPSDFDRPAKASSIINLDLKELGL